MIPIVLQLLWRKIRIARKKDLLLNGCLPHESVCLPCWYLLLVRYFFRWDFDNPQPCYNLHHIGLAQQFFWSEKGCISLSLLHLVWCAQLLLALTHLVVEDALGDECAVHPGKLHPAMLHLCRTAKTQNILVFSILMWLNTNMLPNPNTLWNPNIWLKPNLCKYSTDPLKPLNLLDT